MNGTRTPTTYVKILRADGRSQNGGDMQWSLPTLNEDGTWTAGEWHEVEGSVVPCARGLHAVALEQRYARWHKWDSEHYEVEFVGEVVAHGEGTEQKYVGRRARLLRQIPHEPFWLEARAFVESLNQIAWFSNAGEALPDWDVYETWEAAWDAAWDAARDTVLMVVAWEAAREAAREEARKAAREEARVAARDAAWKAAWDAAWKAAWDAARDATWKAAWDAARDAAWDAALLVACIVAGLRRDGEHYRHAQARMTVWQAGYGLLGDYTDDEGKTRLIVYKKP
jgi:hypothetical protein